MTSRFENEQGELTEERFDKALQRWLTDLYSGKSVPVVFDSSYGIPDFELAGYNW